MQLWLGGRWRCARATMARGQVEVRTCNFTKDASAVERAADFIKVQEEEGWEVGGGRRAVRGLWGDAEGG